MLHIINAFPCLIVWSDDEDDVDDDDDDREIGLQEDEFVRKTPNVPQQKQAPSSQQRQ